MFFCFGSDRIRETLSGIWMKYLRKSWWNYRFADFEKLTICYWKHRINSGAFPCFKQSPSKFDGNWKYLSTRDSNAVRMSREWPECRLNEWDFSVECRDRFRFSHSNKRNNAFFIKIFLFYFVLCHSLMASISLNLTVKYFVTRDKNRNSRNA